MKNDTKKILSCIIFLLSLLAFFQLSVIDVSSSENLGYHIGQLFSPIILSGITAWVVSFFASKDKKERKSVQWTVFLVLYALFFISQLNSYLNFM